MITGEHKTCVYHMLITVLVEQKITRSNQRRSIYSDISRRRDTWVQEYLMTWLNAFVDIIMLNFKKSEFTAYSMIPIL